MSRKKNKRKSKGGINASMLISLKGAVMKWECRDPLVEKPTLVSRGITHRNPIIRMRLGQARNLISDACEIPDLKWKITAVCEFSDVVNGGSYFKGRDMVVRGKLSAATPSYDDMQSALFAENNMDHYVTTHMTAEILGIDGIKDSDFDDRPDVVTRVWK